MRGKAFIEEMFIKPLNAAADKMSAASERIANHQLAMQGNSGIGLVKGLRYMTGRGRQAGARELGKNMDSRVNGIIEARDDAMISPKNWVSKKFDSALNSKNKYVSRSASVFYEGDTGKLATGRIAGVSAGLGLGAYGVLSDDD
jgi:hypothetical protein